MTIKRKKGSIIDFTFWVLALIIFCSLNGVISAFIDVHALFSPLILVLSIFLLVTIRKERSDISNGSLFYLLAIISLVVLGTISALWNFDNGLVDFRNLYPAFRESLTSCIIFLVFYLYAAGIKSEEGASRFVYRIFIIFLLVAGFGIAEGFLGIRDYKINVIDVEGRSLGFFGNPNETGLQANFALSLCLGSFLLGKLRHLPTILFAGVCVAAVIMSFSKTAIITCGLVLILFLLATLAQIKNIRNAFGRRATTLGGLVVVIFLFGIIPNANRVYDQLELAQQKRVNAVVDILIKGEISQRTTSNREAIFKEAVTMIQRQPLLGYGLHTFYSKGTFQSSNHGVHNTFLRLIGEAGFIPLLFFILFLFWILRRAWNHSNRAIGYLAIFIAIQFIAYCMTSHNAYGDKFSIALLGVIVAILRHKEN